jgi:maltoporin
MTCARLARALLATTLVASFTARVSRARADEPPGDDAASQPASEPSSETATPPAKPEPEKPEPAKAATAAEPAKTEPAMQLVPAAPADLDKGFTFGSYGRVSAATNLRGGTPEPATVAAHPPRVVENTYVELELRHVHYADDGWRWQTTITPAFFGEPFHYTGDLAATHLGLRNLNLQFSKRGLTLWAGSKMVRGDDVYLLDYWPLDNLNLVGGGAGYVSGRLELKVHVGSNRLLDPYQHQQVDVPDTVFGAQTIEELDRQRVVGAAKASYRLVDDPFYKVKAVGYLEVQGLPAGTRERADMSKEALPRDYGLVVGAQLGVYGFGWRQAGHANLFVRFARGLAATDWLGVPAAVGVDYTTWTNASELVVGLSGNVEVKKFGLQLGGYARRFRSASPEASSDYWSGWEGVIDARPWYALGGPFSAAIDLSLQRRWPWGLDPTTLTSLNPTIWQIAPMFIITPGGPASYARPQLRVVYRVAHLDEGALAQYPTEDPRRQHTWVHYLGVQAEWWFDSSYQ